MSINNVAHVVSVDKSLKMKIKRTKGSNKVESKHEVVKPDSRSALLSPGQPVSSPSPAVLTSVSSPSSNSASTIATSRMSGGLTSLAASVTAALALPSSASLVPSLSSMPSSSPTLSSTSSGTVVTSHVNMSVTNPTVALLKSVGVGMITSDVSCGNASRGKSPSKTGSPGPDAKDGKSPKTKAAYNKKVKDNKVKIETPISVCSSSSPAGNGHLVPDARTCGGVVTGIQTFNCPQPPPYTPLPATSSSPVTSEPCPGDVVRVKKEDLFHDPYEFNAKVEDKIELPPKKLKLEKADCIETAISPQPQLHPLSPAMPHPALAPPLQQQPEKRSVGVDVISVGVVTEPDCLGPCEPGTLVGLEGIVWKETDNGLLVVNVTWRGKTYVGTLMDATRYAWAPPRPNGCDSPVSDFESRTPKGRGKRNCRTSAQSSERITEGRSLRKGRRGTVNSSSSSFTAPPSPVKSDACSNSMKRKAKPSEANTDRTKRSRSCSRGVTCAESPPPDDYIVCPEPNCHKKYKHMNGLRYHRTHAHHKTSLTGDAKDEEEEEEEDEDDKQKKEKTTLSERAERMKAKERLRMKDKHRTSDRDSRDSLDDDIPLKEIANKVSVQMSNSVGSVKIKAEDESSCNSTDAGTNCASDSSKVKTEDTLLNSADISNQHIESTSSCSNSVPVSCTYSLPAIQPELEPMECQSYTTSSECPASSMSDTLTSVAPISNNNDVHIPFASSAKSQAYHVSPTVAVSGVAQRTAASIVTNTTQTSAANSGASHPLQTSAANSGASHPLQTSAANSGASHPLQTSTTSSEFTHIPQSTTSSEFTHIPQSTTLSGYAPASQSTTHTGLIHTPPSATQAGFSQVPQSTTNSGYIQNPHSTTHSGLLQIPHSTTHSGFMQNSHISTNSTVTAQALPSIACTTGHMSAATPSPTAAMALPPDRQSSGKCPSFLKAVTAVRPIVPAPSPQMGGLNHTHAHTFNSQPSTQPHGPTLKPIQPRPTIMGDYPVVSAALSDLNKDKLKKPKKKKQKGSPGTTPISQLKVGSKGQAPSMEGSDTPLAAISRSDTHKNERSPVITSSNTSKSFEISSSINNLKTQFHSSADSPNLPCHTSNEPPHPGTSRLAIPPSTLSISPFAADKHNSDDVHSPAYSDISDANDSNSPQDSPRKDSSLKKDDHQINGPPHLTTDGNSHSQHYGNMFYFGPPSSYMSHGVNSQGASPSLSKGQAKLDEVDDQKPPGASDHLQDKKDGSRSVQELELQQKSLINYYAHLHGVSPATVQFQFNLAGYNAPGLDPSYAMLTQQALVAEQKRLMQQDHASRSDDGTGQRTPSGLMPGNRPNGPGYDFSGKLKMATGMPDGQHDMKRTNDERDQAHRQKHNDNRQMTPENIDMKAQIGFHQQMELHQQDQQNQHNYQLMKQQNMAMNAQAYQQQRQKAFDYQRQDKRNSTENTNSSHTNSSHTSSKPRHFQDNSHHELLHPDAIKKEVVHPKDTSRTDSKPDVTDTKREIKDESPQPKSSTQDASSRSRASNQPGATNIPPSSISCTSLSSLPSSLATSLPVSLVASLPPAGAAFPYASYYQHFRPVPLDPMYRTISPHIIGYASPAPGYIHHAQLGFRMPSVDADRKSTDTTEPHRGDVAGMGGSPSFPPVHKIHELHEKGRPSTGVSSPALTKPTGGDSVSSQGSTTPVPPAEKVKDKQREYSSSPPTQRHVHTHHHTHVVGGLTPFYPPDAYSAMFGHPATAAATIQTAPHPFPPAHPPATPKS